MGFVLTETMDKAAQERATLIYKSFREICDNYNTGGSEVGLAAKDCSLKHVEMLLRNHTPDVKSGVKEDFIYFYTRVRAELEKL